MKDVSLTKIARVLKNEWFLLVLALLSLTLISLTVAAYLNKSKQYRGVMWQNNITPGETTTEDLGNKLGGPIKTAVENDKLIYFYESGNEFRPHEVEIFQDKVNIIKEQVIADEKGSLNDYLSKFGQPERILYGQHGYAAPANFWGSKGIIVFGNAESGKILEIWYFPPTTPDQFLAENSGFDLEIPQAF